jgi:hypothetical protein
VRFLFFHMRKLCFILLAPNNPSKFCR